MGSQTDRASALLGDLIEGLASAHSEPAIARAAAAALRRHLSLPLLELGRAGTGGQLGGYAVDAQGEPRALEGSSQPALVRAALRSGAQLQPGAAPLAALPLRGEPGSAAYLLLALGPGNPLEGQAWLGAVAQAVASALEHARLVARVAELSRRAHAEGRELRGRLAALDAPGPLVGRGPAMQRVLEAISLVAPQDTTVLIQGETGTGKELVARRVHALSRRAGRAFLAVNCGALPEALVESALFGHERGAFSGAGARHLGLFERADRGTLFLDEVAELPLPAQVKLLRALQEGEFERVGGERTLRAEVRIIAATHRDLEARVQAGQFRADLFYRLHVFPLSLPPLRERPEDLPALAEALLARLASRHGRAPPRLTPEALAQLQRQAWPGNVRELENALERALVVSPGESLGLAEPPPLRAPAAPGEPAALPFREAGRRAIEQALRETGGRVYGPLGAAARLGLKPTTLQSKMRVLGVQRRSFERR